MGEHIRALLVAFCIALVAFGIGARFTNLDRKLYTNDEATASLHVAGHTIADYAAAVFDGRERTVAQLLAYQRAGRATSATDVVRSLATEDPQHPPLFYLGERGWTSLFGSDVAQRRSLSAVCGTLAIAAVAWLAWEAFGTAAAALACGALVAVSPFHVVYAQQTREYALWTLLLAVASASLLAALRGGARRWWIVYTTAVALGLYTDIFFLGTIVAHAVFVVTAGRARRSTIVTFGLATLAALVAFAPWMATLWRASRSGILTNNTFLGAPVPLRAFALKWLFNMGAVFFDADYRWHAAALLLVPILGFTVFAFVMLVRDAPRVAWTFVASMGAVAAAGLLLPDLLRHESRSTSARYLVPLWLSFELAVGWYLARLALASGRRYTAGVAAALVFGLAGVVSCAVASGARTWWSDSSVASLEPVERAIAAQPKSLVAYRATWTLEGAPGERWDFAVMQLADELPATVRFRQYRKDASPMAVITAGTTFVLDPTVALVDELAARKHPLEAIAGEDAHEVRADSLAAIAGEARRARQAAGIVDFAASLWRPGRPT